MNQHNAITSDTTKAVERHDAAQVIETVMGPLVISRQDAEQIIDTVTKAKAANTHRAHASRLAVFRSWLASEGLQLVEGVAMPAPVIVKYLNARWNQGRKLATIDADLAALCYWHAEQGIDSPSRDKAVRDCMAGMRRRTAEAVRDGDATRKAAQADAADAAVIVRMVRVIDASEQPEALRLRDRAMLLMGFALGARRSEIASLRVEHVEWFAQGVTVSIWAGKTGDRQSEVMYNTHASMCAVSALRAWMQHAGIESGPIFRQVIITPRGDRRAVVTERPIAGQVVARTLAKWAEAANLPSGRWSGHSLRAGFCVQGVIDGIPESELRAQTGHKSGVFYGYAQRARAFSVRRNAALRAG
jgi:site-specific recombinase XerD